MANMDTTMLNHISIRRLPCYADGHVYHVHAFMAETSGFTIMTVGWEGARRSRSLFGSELPRWSSASFDEERASSSRVAKHRERTWTGIAPARLAAMTMAMAMSCLAPAASR
jgi:hypothetical protein